MPLNKLQLLVGATQPKEVVTSAQGRKTDRMQKMPNGHS